MMKILVVDGSKEDRREIVEALASLTNVAVQGAVPDLRSAMRVLEDERPDLVVTGLHLSDAEGMQLIEATRKRDHSPPIVVVGMDSSRDEWRRHLDAGADRFVDRDHGLTELKHVVAALAEHMVPPEPHDRLRLLGRLSAGVAQDLHTYLGMLGAMLEILRQHTDDSLLWDQSHRLVAQTTRLTARLLDYVCGKPGPAVAIDVSRLVRDTLTIAGSALRAPITVTVQIPDVLPVLHGIASELEQLVLNLVLDAGDAMPYGGELQVTVEATRSAIVIAVGDTGGEHRPTSSHEVVPPSRGREHGLDIARSVVRRHGGALHSVARDDGGTTVTVSLPLDRHG